MFTHKRGNYDTQIAEILDNLDKCHEAYYVAGTFGGPSLYFHQRALETRHEPWSKPHLEYVYATLSSWGMHRMGKRGSKMEPFDIFQKSIDSLSDKIVEAQQFGFNTIDENQWAVLKEIFRGINVMLSETSLVGNSKVMHHMLPNIIPPIDRTYTLWYLRRNTNITNDINFEWSLMRDLMSGFFTPVVSNVRFQEKAHAWIGQKELFPWDTSPMKIVDNLIIGVKNLISKNEK